MPITHATTTRPATLLRPDHGHGFIEVDTKLYKDALQSLKMKALLGERTPSDGLLAVILDQCGVRDDEEGWR